MVNDDRNYVAEMTTRINRAISGTGWVAGIVAAKLHAELLEKDPDLLDGWLHAIAEQALHQVIRDLSRSKRSVARRRANSRSFAQGSLAADEATLAVRQAKGTPSGAGEAVPAPVARLLGLFRVDHVVDAKQTHKLVRDMTGPDHLFVAENTHQRNANKSLMLAEFHRAVAKKIGKRKTADVFSEEQYEAMYRSVMRVPESAVA